jgi:ABC-2 type transport system permease protein
MLTLIRQELYKQLHSKFYIGWGIVILLTTLLAGYFIQHSLPNINAATSMVSDTQAITLIAMIVFASTIVTGDFSNNTVKYLFARQFSRFQIFISKLVTIVVIYVYLIAVSVVSILITNPLFNKNRAIDWGNTFSVQIFGLSLYLILLLSLVILISNIFKNNGVAIAIALVFYFLIQTINSVLTLFISKFTWLKFNPLNFLNVSMQMKLHAFSHFTQLSLPTIQIGAVVWGLIFLAIAFSIYNHRNV